MDIYTQNSIPAAKSKVCCLNCKSEITLINFSKHYLGKSCLLGFKHSTIPRKQYTTLNCRFCDKPHTNGNSLLTHERFCHSNPKRDQSPFEKEDFHENLRKSGKRNNQYTKAKQLNLPKPVLSKETIEKLSKSSSGKVWTKEQKENHSKIMLEIAKTNPNSYSAGNQGRCKTYEIDGIKLKGSWEVKYYLYCIENNIPIIRPTNGFQYHWEGKTRTYYPDFYHPNFDVYIEIKGYETDRDKAKWTNFPKKLLIFRSQQIKSIEKNKFVLEDFIL